MAAPKRWIFLDIGNVLVGIDRDRAFARFHALSGLDFEEFDWILFGSGLLDDFNAGRISESSFLRRVQGDLRYRGAQVEAPAIVQVWNAMLRPYPGTEAWLQALAQQAEGLWLISDINPLHWRAVFQWLRGLEPRPIRGETLSYRLCLTKPAARMYEHALARSGADPHEVLFVDDRAINVAGAQALGLAALRFEDLEQDRARVLAWAKGEWRP